MSRVFTHLYYNSPKRQQWIILFHPMMLCCIIKEYIISLEGLHSASETRVNMYVAQGVRNSNLLFIFFTFSLLYFSFFTFEIGFPSSENKRVGRGWGGGGGSFARALLLARKVNFLFFSFFHFFLLFYLFCCGKFELRTP